MLSYILSAVPQSIFWKDVNSVYLGCNDAFAKAVGLPSPDLIVGKTDFDLPWQPEEAEAYRKDDQEVIRTKAAKHGIIEPLQQADGSRIWIETTKVPLLDHDGSVFGVLGIYQNITEQKKATEELQREKVFTDAVLNSVPGLLYLYDSEGNLVRWNKKHEELTGYSAEELSRMKLLDWYKGQPEEIAKITAAVERIARDGHAEEEGNLRTKSGKTILFYYTGVPLEIDGKSYFTGIGIDITERKKLEQQLLQAQKMEAVGHLAGGIAHDFNNMLTVILGYGNLIEAALPADSPLRPAVSQILCSAEKSANLTSQLLAFSRKQILTPKATDLNELIKGLRTLLQRILGEDIELKTAYCDKPLIVMVDPGRIEQVILNLCTNARDAMPTGGILAIQTDIEYLDHESSEIHTLENSGWYAVVSVSDTGVGIDEENKASIFDPFFTTKGVGKGTGLGLSLAYGIIKQHLGCISVYSEKFKGSTFKVYLPIVSSAEDEKTYNEGFLEPKGGTERILVGEDDESVRNLTTHILQTHGYRVVPAINGEDCVEKFTKDQFDLVLLDVIMPKMSGKQACDEIRKHQPNIKVIFTSGYTADIIEQKGLTEEGLDFLSKPITPRALLQKVRAVLDRK